MPNEMRFTTAIELPPVTMASLVKAREVEGSTKSVTLEIAFYADAVTPETPEPTEENPEPEPPEPISFRLDNTVLLKIQDTTCTRFRINPTPRNSGDVWLIDQVEIPYAFDQVLGAWFQGGENADRAALLKCAELGLLPAGVAS